MAVQEVVVLWDGAQPDADEVADLVAFVEPDLDLAGTPVSMVRSSGVSYALASWRLLADERDGDVSPGAWRRARLALVTADDGQRLVALARGPEDDPRGAAPAMRHGWALEPMLRHLAWIEMNGRPDLMTRPAWKELSRPEVVDLVLDVEVTPGPDGQGQTSVVRSGDLAVLVGLFDVTEPDQIRAAMGVDFLQQLDHLVRSAELDLDTTEVAYWVLCRDPGTERTAVHLAFLPTRHGQALMPWDLLTDDERRGGHKMG